MTVEDRSPSATDATFNDGANDGRNDGANDGDVIGRYERFRARIGRNKMVDLVYRTIVTIAGFGIIAGGLVLLPLPGPGWLIIFLGLGLLATEYEWSRRLLDYTRDQVRNWVEWVQAKPLYIRMVIGLGCATLVAAAIFAYIWWAGVPGWLPDWVPLVDSLPTRG